MRIIEEINYSEADKKYIPALLVIPSLVIGYAFINGKPTLPLVIGLFIYIVFVLVPFYFLSVRTKDKLLLEVTDPEIYHAFSPTQKPDTVDLSKVKLIRYGRDYIGFEGEDYYAKEIFFPHRYINNVNDVVSLIKSNHPNIKIESHA